MGRPDTVMQGYLSDKERFADWFNGIFFQGEQFNKREQYRNRMCEREEYDMNQAWGGVAQEYYSEGIAQGIAQGITQGIEKGSREKTRMIVQNMLKRGFSDKEICELTGCTADFISELQ